MHAQATAPHSAERGVEAGAGSVAHHIPFKPEIGSSQVAWAPPTVYRACLAHDRRSDAKAQPAATPEVRERTVGELDFSRSQVRAYR